MNRQAAITAAAALASLVAGVLLGPLVPWPRSGPPPDTAPKKAAQGGPSAPRDEGRAYRSMYIDAAAELSRERLQRARAELELTLFDDKKDDVQKRKAVARFCSKVAREFGTDLWSAASP